MRPIAPDTSLVDVRFRGYPEYIGCHVLETGRGVALIDPGPTSTLPALEEGLRLAGLSTAAVTHVLLTHIHLDHAGATGTLVRRHPGIEVLVHARGARHLVDPTRLLASAERLYGERMDELWGEFLAVPRERVRALEGGERLHLGRRHLEVAHTPGHAVHHVAYHEPDSGLAWVGDTLGIRIDNRPFVMPVTPPPDIDLEAWRHSQQLIADWKPGTLCPTHYGPARPAIEHIEEHRERLERWANRVAADLRSGASESVCIERFRDTVHAELETALPAADLPAYLLGGGVVDSWHGLARYWRKRGSR